MSFSKHETRGRYPIPLVCRRFIGFSRLIIAISVIVGIGLVIKNIDWRYVRLSSTAPSTPDDLSSVSVEGFTLTIMSIKREHNIISIYYRLQYAKGDVFFRMQNRIIHTKNSASNIRRWILTDTEQLAIRFFDISKQNISVNTTDIYLGDDFIFGKTDSWESKFVIDIPVQAKYLTIKLENTTLVTNLLSIPE